MRVVVFGYHEVGCACLTALLELGQRIVLVVTHRDDPGENVWFGSVQALAQERGLAVEAPADVNAPAFVETVRGLRPDVFLSCYFRQILGQDLLAIPARGAYNMHGSLLPKYRGRAPVNWVLVRGESLTGVTLHHMADKPDRGDIVAQKVVPIEAQDTAMTLHRTCAAAAGDLIRELWPLIAAGQAPRIPQDPAKATYFGRRRPEDGRIAWSQPARACGNLVRAVTHPYPGAFTLAEGRKLYVWRASVLELEVVPSHDAPARGAIEQGKTQRDETQPGETAGGEMAGAEAGRGGTRHVRAGREFAGGSVPREPQPGTISAVVPGRGFEVVAGQGSLLVERAQLEGSEELPGEDFISRGLLGVGQRLG